MGGVHLEIDHIPCLTNRADVSFARCIFFSNFVAQNEFDRIFERSSLFASFRFWRNSNRSPYSPDLSLGGVFETARIEKKRDRIAILSSRFKFSAFPPV